jgi:hypothetical protein
MEDYLELHDPKVNAIIAEGHKEYLAGKTIPGEQLLRELRQMQKKQKAKNKKKQ